MIIRRIVLAIGVLIALIGLSQLVFASWWIGTMPAIMQPMVMRMMGLVMAAMSILLLAAAIRRVVRLIPLVLILGVVMLVGAIFLTLCPEAMKDSVYGYFINRPYPSLVRMAYAGGLFRTLLGIALIYAAMR